MHICEIWMIILGLDGHEIVSRNHCSITLLLIANERLEFLFQKMIWQVSFTKCVVKVTEEHLKQNNENELYFTRHSR